MTSSNSYHVSEDGGMSFGGSELGITRPHSMSSLRGASSYTNGNHAEDGVRRLSDPYQSLEPVAESSMYIRHPQHGCWTPQDWMNEIPTSMDMGMMDPTPSQSPTAQQWADEQAEAENRAHMQLRMSNENGMPVMVGGIAHPLNSFRLALPPSGRNVQRMPSCPNFRAPSAAGYHLQEPPSPAQEDHELSHYSGYVGRSRSTSSSMPSPPESPDFYFSTNPQHRSGGYPSTPLPGQETFPQDVYGMASLNSNAMPRANVHHRPTRASSRGVPSSAAAKSSSKRSKSRSARRVSGHTNLRNQSRNGSIASRGGLGIGSDNSEMSFVNFTPQDATRILSGVAPSGSSKTKARREREALEKRRKLSEAAAAAVMAAGGDASQLPGLLTI
ncbi:hypothetical protein DFH27DRAFT_550391 [Peziza echinospora]|nr:hypothetical protein DFH27DRAFT_550391 [Peziza echinospora]